MLLLTADAAAAPSLDKAALDLVRNATYEVVVEKPDEEKSGITYEKPLPWDLLPYYIRNDDYYSIGTAFAIGPNTFVSAAHVMTLHTDSQLGEAYLRDRNGEVFAIEKIVKYSFRRDFVVFTLKDATAAQYLEVNEKPTLNEQVFAVGNALGQGIVIRQGLYTSNTPEEYEGAWEWLRFSAAASPGNSGGPLLDPQGRTIGVVLRKSENENLNYALPMSVVMESKDNLATMNGPIIYKIENMDWTYRNEMDIKVELPLPYMALRKALSSGVHEHVEDMTRKFMKEHEAEMFPRGPKSAKLLHNNYSAVFPHVIAKSDDGYWDTYYPSERKNADLGKNGFLTYGKAGNTILMRVRKPDDVSMETFTNSPKTFMDLVLQGIPVTRDIGSESIRITSLGEAARDHIHTDAYDRKWQVRTWNLPYKDGVITTFSLPVPGGNVTMLKYSSTGDVPEYIADLEVLSDFVYLSYYGTLEDWGEFVALDTLLPTAFGDIDVDFEYGDHFRYRSDRLSFRLDATLMDITKDSDIKLCFSYFEEDGEVTWDVAEVMVGESKNNTVFFDVERNLKPAATVDDKHKKTWNKIVRQDFPFNGEPFINDKNTYIAAVYTDGMPLDRLPEAPHLYTIHHSAEGTADKEVMRGKLQAFSNGLKVMEGWD
ncbi:MAG: trypsin-like peptidase domain-containing protein [Gammaproteobacteria bacterium]|nr:trypsin-like peptidase domain-containing protein [Gammaproteobacteria bacterium]